MRARTQGRLLFGEVALFASAVILAALVVFLATRAMTGSEELADAFAQRAEILHKTSDLKADLANLQSGQAQYALQTALGLLPPTDEAPARAAFLRQAEAFRVTLNALLTGQLSGTERSGLEELHAGLLAFRRSDAELIGALRLTEPAARQRATAAALAASASAVQSMSAAIDRVAAARVQQQAARGDSSSAADVRTRVIQATVSAAALGIVLVLAWLSAMRREAGLRGKLKHLTVIDELTGLPNRKAWNERLAAELARAIRQGATLSVVLLDLDRFKAFNSKHGRSAGDALLVAAGQAWKSALRRDDFIARSGGNEFALILPACASPQAAAMADRLRGLTPSGQPFSAGIASWDRRETAEHLMERVEGALRRAKAEGRNRSVAATDER